ncbi:MAG: AEC family transporter [Lachnospiraceae bacterium]|nr:AEC family transporter [Lachnospiraceae bacterium]
MIALTSLWQMIIIFILLSAGFACRKTGLVTEDGSRCISRLVVNVFNPAIILSSLTGSGMDKNGLWVVFLTGCVSFMVLILAGRVFSCVMSRNKDTRHMYELMMVFSNIGFIGIPVIKALFGSDALVYAAIFIFEYNILIYTYGYALIKPESGKKTGFRDTIKSVFNIGTVSCIAALAIFVSGIRLPYVLSETISCLGNAATPLSVMAIGFTMGSGEKISRVFTKPKQYLFAFVKLVAVPVIMTFILKKIFNDNTFCRSCMVMLGLPIGTMPLLLATESGQDGKLCSDNIILTTLLSIGTIPVLMAVYPYI